METDRYDDREPKEDMFDTVANLVERLNVNYRGKDVKSDDDNQDYDNQNDDDIDVENGEVHEDDADDGFKVVEEVESLCMNCQENVPHLMWIGFFWRILSNQLHIIGHDSTFSYQDPLFSRDHPKFILL